MSHTKILNRQPSLSRLERIQCIPLYLLIEVTGAGFSCGNFDYFWDSVYTVQYLWPKILTYPLNMMTETLRDYREQCIFSLFYHQLKYRNLPKIIFTSVVCIEVGYILQYTYSIANTISVCIPIKVYIQYSKHHTLCVYSYKGMWPQFKQLTAVER